MALDKDRPIGDALRRLQSGQHLRPFERRRLVKLLAKTPWREVLESYYSTEEMEVLALGDPLFASKCHFCGNTADNFHVSDEVWSNVEAILGQNQACFKCFRIAAWNAGLRGVWEVRTSEEIHRTEAKLTEYDKYVGEFTSGA